VSSRATDLARREITLSVVSHRQNALVSQLLSDIERHCADRVSLVITQNVADPVAFETQRRPFPVELIVNARKKGFGANHNAAFAKCQTPFFCVANPDLRLRANPFISLIKTLSDPAVGVVGPLVRNPSGSVEDSARRFPTVWSLLGKLWGRAKGPDYATDHGPIAVDWIAGMFMLFRADTYRAIGGFDEDYFLYYEDVDLCRRLARSGLKVVYNPLAEVVHDARRASHRDIRLAGHHIASIVRFLTRGG
jgi:N-acetylglucosaminyl-diphospho-decaprenol L-rhamnosyltransferase